MLDADAARFDTRSNRTLNTPHTHLKRHKLQGPTPAAIPQCLLQVFSRFPPIAPPTSRDRDRSIADRRRRTSPCRSTISRKRRGEVRRPRARLDREYSRDVETPRATLRRVVCTTHSRCASDASARDRDARARKIFRRAGARAEARRGAGSGRTDARWDGRAMVIRPRRRVILTRGVARDANEGGARAVSPFGEMRASIARVRGGCRVAIARWDGKMSKILVFCDTAWATPRGGADVEAKRTNRKTDDGERGDTNSKPHINTLHRHKYGISFHLRIRERGSPG